MCDGSVARFNVDKANEVVRVEAKRGLILGFLG